MMDAEWKSRRGGFIIHHSSLIIYHLSPIIGPAKLTLAVVVVALALLIAAPGVFAHASLVRAEPGPGAALLASPERVILWFAEPVEHKFSEIRVLDSGGSRVDNGDSAIYGSDPRTISVSLQPLGRGVYTVAWSNVSALDGRALRDTFTFAVGQVLGPPTGESVAEQHPLFQSPLDPFLHWLSLLNALFMVGGLGFCLLAAGPRLRTHNWLALRLARRINSALWAAAASLTAAEFGKLMVQASVLYDLPLNRVVGPALVRVLQETEWGHLWLWRVVLLWAAVAMTMPGLRSNRAYVRNAGGWLALLLGAVVLATYSLASHVSALTELRVAGTLNAYLHLLAAALWVGGLAHFLLIMPALRALPAEVRLVTFEAIVPRFSTVSSLSVAALITTGLYSAWAMAGTAIPAYTQTPYGLSLLAKIALVAPLLGAGAWSAFWVWPRFSQGPAQEGLHRLLLGQVLLAVLVLLSVGFLTTLEPARLVAAREGLGQEEAMLFPVDAGDKRIMVRVEPGRLGPNRFRIWVSDRRGNPIDDVDVNLRLVYTGADLGAADVSATSRGGGEYSVERVPLGIAGLWRLELTVRNAGSADAGTTVRLNIVAAAAGSSSSVPVNMGNLLFIAEILLLGFLFIRLT